MRDKRSAFLSLLCLIKTIWFKVSALAHSNRLPVETKRPEAESIQVNRGQNKASITKRL